MKVVPYDFTKAKFKDDLSKGYWVTLYMIFDGSSVYHFAHHYDCFENEVLAHQLGVSIHSFKQTILVTPFQFPDIFKEIEDYVSNSDMD